MRRIFHEMDLCVAEALSGGLLDGLSAPELASVLSAFTYEHRSPGPRPEVWIPSGPAYRRLSRIGAALDDLPPGRAGLRRGVHPAPGDRLRACGPPLGVGGAVGGP